jgi:recombination protein RecR
MKLAHAISDVKKSVRHCSICFNLTDTDPCPICADPRRDASQVLVVEQPKDLINLEQTGMYRGVYHVLMGRLDPLNNVGPEDITLNDLLARVNDPSKNSRGEPVREVILGLNPDMEGDGTALHIAEELGKSQARRHEGTEARSDQSRNREDASSDSPLPPGEGLGVREPTNNETETTNSARTVRISRLARGLPTGSQIEYANRAVLSDAIQGRQEMG